MTSPGREALAEAARCEAARVYGQTCPETTRAMSLAADVRDRDLRIGELRAEGLTMAAIALRVGASKSLVSYVLRQAS